MRKKRRSYRVVVADYSTSSDEDDLLDNVKKCKISDNMKKLKYSDLYEHSDKLQVSVSDIVPKLLNNEIIENSIKLSKIEDDMIKCDFPDFEAIDESEDVKLVNCINSNRSKCYSDNKLPLIISKGKCPNDIENKSDSFTSKEEVRILCKCGQVPKCKRLKCDNIKYEVVNVLDIKCEDKSDGAFLHLFTDEGVMFVPCDSWSNVIEKCREAVDPNQRTWKSADNSKCMYTMRMLEGGTGAADSDSAVSSMGSERVPSLTSDTDWMETNSDSGHTPADHFMAAGTDIHSKMRWFDYSYCRQHSGEPGGSNSNHRMPPVAQKKHHLYGKRLFQEQPSANNGPTVPTSGAGSPGGASSTGGGASSTRSPSESSSKFDYNGVNVATPSSQTSVYDHPASPLDMVKPQPQEVKYSCSLEFARQNLCGAVRSSPSDAAVHNHTYHLPPEHLGVLQRPLTRDKRELEKDWDSRDEDEEDLCVGKRGCSDDDISTSRDERRARSLNIPITVSDIINLPMDEFNERLSKFDLSETQLSLIRDIRRRGKNKVAAQNCRKRKLDQILSLADEVKAVRDKKQKLLHERDCLLQERVRVKNTVSQLFRHIFQSLRDEDGNAYSPRDWSLEEAPDGSIVLVPRDASDLTIVRPHLANSSRAENDQDSHDLHQPSTSKKHLHPRKHVP